jgi:hypothetical protein
MSLNLHLSAPGKDGKYIAHCDLVQTPTKATKKIIGKSLDRYEVMLRYFEWLDHNWNEDRPGTRLDHKLEVATFLVQYPRAGFWEG